MTTGSHIEIYLAEDSQARIQMRLEEGTLWLSQAQLTELFDKDVNGIGEHIGNIFGTGELDRTATAWKFRVVRQEGTRQVGRKIEHHDLGFSLDETGCLALPVISNEDDRLRYLVEAVGAARRVPRTGRDSLEFCVAPRRTLTRAKSLATSTFS